MNATPISIPTQEVSDHQARHGNQGKQPTNSHSIIAICVLTGVCFLCGCATSTQKTAELDPLPPAVMDMGRTQAKTDSCEIAIMHFSDDMALRHFGLPLQFFNWIAVRTVVTNKLEQGSLMLQPEAAELVTAKGSFPNSKRGELEVDLVRNEKAQRAAYVANHTRPAPGPYSMDATMAQASLVNGIMAGNTAGALANYNAAMSPQAPALPGRTYDRLAKKMEDCRLTEAPLPAHSLVSGFLYFKLPGFVTPGEISSVTFHVKKSNSEPAEDLKLPLQIGK